MAQNCPSACGRCVADITDRDGRCFQWAINGGCVLERVWHRCPHSCGRCAKPERKLTVVKSITNPDFPCGGPTHQEVSLREAISGRTRTHLLGISGPVGSEILLNVTCGAAPIAPHYLLTAAHCVVNTVYTPRSIHLGANDLTNPESAKYDIEEIRYHPDYNPNSAERYNDIAIIKTTQPIRFSDRVYPFCVSPDEVSHNTPVTVQGYGFVNETSKALYLQEAQLFIVGQQECERAYEREGTLNHLQLRYPFLLQHSDVICAAAYMKDACQGDSGGPLFLQDREGRRFIVGIVSNGKECGSILPGTYISVAKHINFIDSVLYNTRN
ncbi:serine protease Hayan-like isoform X2 [Penaeus chinensis]|nr:serine protease Hayan-like isoform X2 [Penaeus chinensis]